MLDLEAATKGLTQEQIKRAVNQATVACFGRLGKPVESKCLNCQWANPETCRTCPDK